MVSHLLTYILVTKHVLGETKGHGSKTDVYSVDGPIHVCI